MRVAGLFAGVGGLEVGLRSAGFVAELFAENWAPAATVLAHRFDGVPNAGDIASLRSLPRNIELLTAGFPCQDLSQAGLTAGIGGKRSGLVDHVFRLLDRKRVPWVVLENVSFMLQLDGGRAMLRLVTAFEERGYRWAYRVVNSLSFVPQRRERVFFVASRQGDPADVVLVDEVAPPSIQTSLDTHAHGFYWTEGIRGLGWAPDCVPTLKNGSTVGIASPPAILTPDGLVGKPDIRDAERLQGFLEDWTEPAERAHRSSWRWSLIGNAVTVPVAEWVGRRLRMPGVYSADRDRPISAAIKWPRAARFDGRRRHAVEISSFPEWAARPPLIQFLRYPLTPLSARATKGFLERTQRSTLRFPPGFKDRVGAHLLIMQGGAMPLAAE